MATAVSPAAKAATQSNALEQRASRIGVEPLLLRADEAAVALGLGRSTIYELLASGKLPAIRFGRAIRVPKAALEAWIREQTAANVDANS